MSFTDYKYDVGLSNVGSYQVSGKPFASTAATVASGSTAGAPDSQKITFPSVTKQITVINSGATTKKVRVAFSVNGLRDNSNYILVHPAIDGVGSITLDVKATELYLMSNDSATPTVSVYASLTGIPVERINNISPGGSNWAGSVGVG